MENNTIDLGMELDSLSLSEENIDNNDINNYGASTPQEQLLVGITNKDIQCIEDAINKGANIKLKMGKEKMGAFAFRYFNEDVCDYLIKKGVSFKDIKSLVTSALNFDSADALKWLYEKNSADKNRREEIIHLTKLEGVDKMALNCINYLTYDLNLCLNYNLNINTISNFFFSSLKSDNQKSIDLFFQKTNFEKYTKDIIINLFNTKLNTNLKEIDLLICKKIETIFSKDNARIKIWNEIFPITNQDYYENKDLQGIVDKMGIGDTILSNKSIEKYKSSKNFWAYTHIEKYKINNFMEGLVTCGAPVLKEIIKSKKGRQLLFNHLFQQNDTKKLILFMLNANKDLKFKITKDLVKDYNDEIISWRDDKNNTILHYLRYTDYKLTDANYEDLFRISSKDLFETANDLEVLACEGIGLNAKAKLEKRIIKKELNPSYKEKDKPLKRKM